MYIWKYKTSSEFDDIFMCGDGENLTGLWFENSKDSHKHNIEKAVENESVFKDVIKWLDIYFSGKEPDFNPSYKINYTSDFRKEVISEIEKIPYGKIVTYGDIAKVISEKRNIKKMSAQAVGGAVGWNPVCIIVPCHRVLGLGGKLTGYGGGLKNKIALLELEKIKYKN